MSGLSSTMTLSAIRCQARARNESRSHSQPPCAYKRFQPRDSEASRYTERDTPIFVGQHVEIRAALDALDGASSRVEA